jgi:tight adherence protein C
VTAAAIVGCALGLGLYLIVRGLFPSRPTLAMQVATLLNRREPEPAPPESKSEGVQAALEQRYGSSLVELLATAGLDLRSTSRMQDLRVTGGRIETLVVEKVMLATTGALFPLLLSGGLSLGGVHLPTGLLALASLLFGAAGFLLPDASLRQRANERRKSFRYALSAFLDLVSISLAGGGLVQGSLQDAVAVGRGWAFDEFRRPLELTREKGRPPWEDVGRLGQELGVPELEELAGSLTLAGAEGARVRQSLMAKAESLRQRRMSEAEAEANESSERMVLPLVLLGLGFLLFLGYPAVSRVISGI